MMAPTLGTGVSSLPPEGSLAAVGSAPGGGSAASMPLLQVRDLTVRFGAKEVVRSVNFSIAQGEKLALVGESGSGKTITALSLLRLAGEAKISGQAMLRGRDLLSLSEREMRGIRGGEIAMVFQEPMTALNPLMTIGQQIAEVLELKRALTTVQSAQAAIELLAKTGIPEPERRGGLVGQQQRGLARQGHGDHGALALAAAQLVRKAVGPALGLGNAGFC